MKTLLLAALLLCPLFLQAGVVKVISPNTAQTYSYSDMTWHSLRWDGHQLRANITFSTYNYVTHYQPLEEETYDFVFPGVKYDATTGIFTARAANGRRIPVAKMAGPLSGIQPLPGTVIYIVKQSGKVLVALTGTDEPSYPYQSHWVEDNQGFFLTNVLRAGVDRFAR